jgi:ATP-dependent Clp protease ATP-binding subunit ClpB
MAEGFERELLARVVGQDQAVRDLCSLYELALAGLNGKNRPIGTMLLLGPTGSGKTWLAEAAAEVLYGTAAALIKVDCAEYQHPHEIAKIIGSPPGYVGHGETSPLFTQDVLDRRDRNGVPLAIVLFDDIEKASPVLWQLLLGVLDRGTLALGDNRRVDFRRTIVLMSSNLGADEISAMRSGSIGFRTAHQEAEASGFGDEIQRAALEAARRHFSPEFMNRIDKTVVFRPIAGALLREVLAIELSSIQQRILRDAGMNFQLRCGIEAQELLVREGTDRRYGARQLKRAIDRLLLTPLARLITSGQVSLGDVIDVQIDHASGDLSFHRIGVGESEWSPRPDIAPVVPFQIAHERDRQAAIFVATAVAISAAVGLATGLTAAGLPLRRSA